LSPTLGRIFTHILAQTWLVNILRLTVAFLLMLLPATAMGLSLPLLAKTLARSDVNFGRVLGRLYGWNTLGGVAGTLCSEMWLIRWLGLRGTALAAGTLNLVAAALALFLFRRAGGSATAAREAPRARRGSAGSRRLLTAAFLAGATLLALEVVWFRFLQFFVYGTSFIFAMMLATVLLGIGAGGVVAARWLGRDPQAYRFAPPIALAAGVAVELSYISFKPQVGGVAYTTASGPTTIRCRPCTVCSLCPRCARSRCS
jgi:hypothetical protein